MTPNCIFLESQRTKTQKAESCLAAIKSGTSQNFLQLNTGKTEKINICPKQDQCKFEAVWLRLDGSVIQQSACVKDLGVLFDPHDQHVKSIVIITAPVLSHSHAHAGLVN